MRMDTPEEVHTTGTASVGKERRLRVKAKRELDKRMLDLTLFKSCKLKDLPIIGDKIALKKKNTIRFYFENLNGIRSGLWGTDKGRYFTALIKKLDVDCFGAAETNLQWTMAQTSPTKILNLKQGSRTKYSCNKNETITEKQQGGTCITMKEQYGQYVKEMGADETGLGRWSWLRMEGNNDIKTTVITAYSPCKLR